MNSIMSPEPPTNDLLRQMMLQLSPAKTSLSLSQQVAGLSQAQQQLVMSSAKLLQTGMAMQGKPISWASLIEQFYPNLAFNIKSIIAAVLQENDPKDVVGRQRSTVKADAQAEFLEGYASKLKPAQVEQPDTPVEEDESVNNLLSDIFSDAYGGERETVSNTSTQNKAFLDKLALSESSGKTDAEITIKDGGNFTGKHQFSEARLTDYRNSTKEKFSTADFKQDEALQNKVANWHFSDISSQIDKLGDATNEFDRDRLKAVAHLGGIGGMKSFVRSKGQYNPSDELGTSLQEYYNKSVNAG